MMGASSSAPRSPSEVPVPTDRPSPTSPAAPRPPRPVGDVQSIRERSQILANLSRKADLVTRALNHMPGVQSLPVEGAMYAFPQVYLPQKFVQEAESLGKAADMLYCIKMLEATGEDKLKRVLARMATFHLNFLERYLSPSERAIEDKTPTPCLPKYSASIQTEIVEAHLKGKPAQDKLAMFQNNFRLRPSLRLVVWLEQTVAFEFNF
eukprot:g2663.t1